MKRLLPAAILVTLLASWCSARAGDWPFVLFDGCHWHFQKLCDEWKSRKCWCPDDYLPKCLPCVPPNPKGCCDDYCPKCLPHVPPNPKGCCDDYEPKCCPIIIQRDCPACSCGPPEDCHPGCCDGKRCKP